MTLLLANWKLALGAAIFAALLGALGVQTYRLQGMKAERDVLVLEKAERIKRDAMREAQNLKNKERTDEEFDAARRRALAKRVPTKPIEGIRTEQPTELAGGGDASTVCFDRGSLSVELAGFAQRHAARLTRLLTDVAQRDGERLAGIAQQSEEVAAAYRACRAYVLNLAGSAPGKAEHDGDVGGVSIVPALPVLRLTEEWEGEPNSFREGTSFREPASTTLAPDHHARSAP